jgi:hypothetical protein
MSDDKAKYATIFAAMVLAVIAVIAVTAIVEYTVDDALRIWDGLDVLLGVIVSGAAGYFFGIGATNAERKRADVMEALARHNKLLP